MTIFLSDILLSFLLCVGPANNERVSLNWLPIEVALEKSTYYNKIIMLEFETKWCHFCKKLEKEVFSNKDIITELNKNFINVKIDAEKNDKYFRINNSIISYQEFSKILGIVTYPTILFINTDFQEVGKLEGFYNKEAFQKILTHIYKKAD